MPGRPSALSENDALEGLREATASRPVATTPEVAEQCDVTTPTVSDRLEELEEAGKVETHLAGRTRIWWVVENDTSPDELADKSSREGGPREGEDQSQPTEESQPESGLFDRIMPSVIASSLLGAVLLFVLGESQIAVASAAIAGGGIIEQTHAGGEGAESHGVLDMPHWLFKGTISLAALAVIFAVLYIEGALVWAGAVEIAMFAVALALVVRSGAEDKLSDIAKERVVEAFFIVFGALVLVGSWAGLLPREVADFGGILILLSIGSLLLATIKITIHVFKSRDDDSNVDVTESAN